MGEAERAPKAKLRWYQYRLAHLFIFVTICAIPCSWFAWREKRLNEFSNAIAPIRQVGGLASGKPGRGVAGVRHVSFGPDLHSGRPSNFSDLQLHKIKKCLENLPNLEGLWLLDTGITDEGVEDIKKLTTLKALDLAGTKVTDAGVEHLNELVELRELRLHDTQVTDTGLEHLKGLTELRKLSLGNWNRARGWYGGETRITDTGLECLKGLINLKELQLYGAQVTDEGVKKLQKALPNCEIEY